VVRSSSAYGSFYGVRDLIVNGGGSNVDTTSEEFTYEVFDDAMKLLWENGYDDNTQFVMLVPSAGKQTVGYIHESALRGAYGSETTRGMMATHLLSNYGHEVPVIPSTVIGTDEFYILNLDLITVRFMDTLLAYDVPLGTSGSDKMSRRFITEFSLELHNRDTAHFMATNKTFSRPS